MSKDFDADTQKWREKAKYFDFQGHQIAFWTGGDATRPPLLLVHGFPTCAWDWGAVWETLGAQHHLIAVSYTHLTLPTNREV